MIRIQYFGSIRDFTKCKEETGTASSLGEVMDFVKTKYGKDALRAMKASMVTLDGVRMESLKRSLPLPEGSIVGIYPLCGGG